MFGFGNRNLVLGLFIVGSNKTYKGTKLKESVYKNNLYKNYRGIIDIKMAQMETGSKLHEWVVDDEMVEDIINAHKDTNVVKDFRRIAREKLSQDYKGFGDDFVDLLVTIILLVFVSMEDSFKNTKPGAVSLIIKAPKYVTMLFDKDSAKHNSINWLIDNNSFISNIYDVAASRAYECGYKGDILTVLRWTNM